MVRGFSTSLADPKTIADPRLGHDVVGAGWISFQFPAQVADVDSQEMVCSLLSSSPQIKWMNCLCVSTIPACWTSTRRISYSVGVNPTACPSIITLRRARSTTKYRPDRLGQNQVVLNGAGPPQTGGQLTDPEGFDEIIIRPGIQGLDLVLFPHARK